MNSPSDYPEGSIKSAEPGDLISVSGISNLSKDYKDLVFEIQRINRYESDGETWYEYLGKIGDQPYWIEWEEDDDLQITGTDTKDPMKLSEIETTEEELARMDDEESRDNYIFFNGKKFFYESSIEAVYFKDNGKKGEGFYVWDFISENNEEVITVEKWEGEPFEVYLSYVIPPDQITVSKR